MRPTALRWPLAPPHSPAAYDPVRDVGQIRPLPGVGPGGGALQTQTARARFGRVCDRKLPAGATFWLAARLAMTK